MKRLVAEFVGFVHHVECGDGPMTTCDNAICRWASRQCRCGCRCEWCRTGRCYLHD